MQKTIKKSNKQVRNTLYLTPTFLKLHKRFYDPQKCPDHKT